jgi:hypothetical protein
MTSSVSESVDPNQAKANNSSSLTELNVFRHVTFLFLVNDPITYAPVKACNPNRSNLNKAFHTTAKENSKLWCELEMPP